MSKDLNKGRGDDLRSMYGGTNIWKKGYALHFNIKKEEDRQYCKWIWTTHFDDGKKWQSSLSYGFYFHTDTRLLAEMRGKEVRVG